MSKRWEYYSVFYATKDFRLSGGNDAYMTYDGNVSNWEAYAVVPSKEAETDDSEPVDGFRVFFKRPSTKPIDEFY